MNAGVTEDALHISSGASSSLAEPLLSVTGDPFLSSPQQKEKEENVCDGDDDNVHNNATGRTEELSNGNVDSNGGSADPTFWGLAFYKFLYFLNGLSASTWGRFGVIYYNDVCGLTPEQIGLLQGISPLLSFLCMPVWGFVADAWWHSRKRVYLVTKALNTACLLTLAVLPNHQFGLVFFTVMGMSVFRSSGVLDAYVLDYLGPRHQGQYGTIRLYTAISWGLGAVGMGWMTDHWGNFQANFTMYGTMMTTLIIVVAMSLPTRSKSEQLRYENSFRDNDRDNGSMNFATRPRPQALFRILFRIPILVWLVQVMLIGTGMALVDTFLFVYLQNELHASTQLCGLTVGMTVLLELPIFHKSEFLLRIVGHDLLFAISMLAYIVRAFGYTSLTPTTVHWVLLLEVLHGITFACMWIASIDFSATVAPPEWSTTVQTILSASFGSFGCVVGSIVGGRVMQAYSADILYRGMGWIMLLILLLHLVAWLGFGQGHDAFLDSLQMEDITYEGQLVEEGDSGDTSPDEMEVEQNQRDAESGD